VSAGACVWLAAAAALATAPPPDGQAPATAATAAAADTCRTAYRLEEVVVYGRTPANPGMVTDLRDAALVERGGGDIAQVLRFDPALHVTTGTKAETETRLRGMPARATLILVDGRPVNPGYYGKVDLTMVATAGIAAVQVIKGPASAAYGPNTMGGVINIITRSGFDAPGTTVGARFGADGRRRLSLDHAAQQGLFAYSVYGYEQYQVGFRLSDDFAPTSLEDGGLRFNSGFRKAGGGVKIGYTRTDWDIYTATFDYHWSRRDIPATIYAWEAPTWRRFPRWARGGVSLNNQRRLGQDLELVTVLYADAQDDRLLDYLDRRLDDQALAWDSRLRNRSLGGSLQLGGVRWTRHRFRAGLTYRHDIMKKQPEADVPWVRHTLSTGSLFVEDQYAPAAALTVTGGLQGTAHATERRESTGTSVSPSLAVQWTPLPATAFRAAYARAVRYPTLHALYSETSGNTDLRPEVADRYEIGLEHRLLSGGGRRLTVEIAGFINELSDLIDRPVRSQQYRNVSAATLRGIETAIRAVLSPSFAVDAGHVWIDTGAAGDAVMQDVSPHRFSGAVTAGTSRGMRLRYDVTLVDERISHVPGRPLTAYQLHGISIRQPLGRGLTFHGEVFNLTDAHFEEELGYPAPGRTFAAGFDWTR